MAIASFGENCNGHSIGYVLASGQPETSMERRSKMDHLVKNLALHWLEDFTVRSGVSKEILITLQKLGGFAIMHLHSHAYAVELMNLTFPGQMAEQPQLGDQPSGPRGTGQLHSQIETKCSNFQMSPSTALSQM